MIYLFLAEGFEEIEALGTLDVLRRAGVETKTVGVTGAVVTGSHGIPVTADLVIEDAVKGQDLDGVILPGGMPGTKNLEASDLVKDFLQPGQQSSHRRYLCRTVGAGTPWLSGRKESNLFPRV